MKARTQIGIGLIGAGFSLALLISCLILVVLRRGTRGLFTPGIFPVILILVVPIILSSGYIVSIIRGALSLAVLFNRAWLLLGVAFSVVRVFLWCFEKYYGVHGFLSADLFRIILEYFLIFGLPYIILRVGIIGLEKKIEADDLKRIKDIADAYRGQGKTQD